MREMEAEQVTKCVPMGWELVDYCTSSESTLLLLIRDALHRYGIMGLNVFGLGTTLPSIIPLSQSNYPEIARVFSSLPFLAPRIGESRDADQVSAEVILGRLVDDLFAVEGFRVRLTARPGVLLHASVASYAFSKSAKNSWSVSDWKQKRFVDKYPGVAAEVLDSMGNPVHGRALLSTVRRAYKI
jgi:hypothetical protein